LLEPAPTRRGHEQKVGGARVGGNESGGVIISFDPNSISLAVNKDFV